MAPREHAPQPAKTNFAPTPGTRLPSIQDAQHPDR
jgi:hypothetical protein